MVGIKGNHKEVEATIRHYFTRKAGADIGINNPDPNRYPLAPVISTGVPVYISETSTKKATNIEVKTITVANTTNVARYDGVTLSGAHSGEPVTVWVGGEIWIPAGYTAVNAGDLVIWEINSTENSNAAVQGDVIPYAAASGASTGDGYSNNSAGSLADIAARNGALVGRALTNTAARTDANTFEYVLVRLKKW